ncbi:histidine kinase dimerization/phosphoacceptor domain -containing protein [Methanobacterium aggregans]|uniref:histidine kinase dimerization/phosphoacceptor domain -containing protein n=1 Tax=Methanobacterium aggregans TaxID=1615586 RepID=UPI001AE1B526|nr:histidine kinase dimerization/phosphoacceptor domain -containing protein [Methanobacterium aggregans]MBP2046353.1 two-component system response regulator [Methanobacterium aggregans]
MQELKILILEDYPPDAELAKLELEEDGLEFSSRVVDNEEDFLRELDEFEPQLILSDYKLPTFDGISALKLVRQSFPEKPFIFVSGTFGEDFAVETLKKGATDYVLKENISKLPFAVKRALKEVEKTLKRERAEKALKNSEMQYRTTINALDDILIVVDHHMQIILFNQTFERMKREFGMGKALKGQSMFEALPFLPENLKEDYLKIFETGETMITEEYHVVSGVEMVEEVRKIPIFEDEEVVRILTIIRDVTERKNSENRIKASLNEKEALLKEIHHRVKNNMQIISSLLNLQATQVKDESDSDLFKASQDRVRSMALIHAKLYQSDDLSSINFSEYINSLAYSLLSSYDVSSSVKLNMDLEDISLNIETAIPCGLILNELLTNSIKHAFPNGEGEIFINLKKGEDDKFQLIVGDDGVGFPEDLDFQKTETLGMQLVMSLINQIDGKIEIERNDGSRFKLIFGKLEYEERI